jgi:lipase
MKDIHPEILKLRIGDVDIQYLSYPGDGPHLVLMHATGFNPWLWHPIARRLADRYRIIAPYFCDHREGEPETGGVEWKHLAQDLARLCESIHVEKPYVAGHSMGATVITIANVTFGLNAVKMILMEPILLPRVVYTTRLTLEQHPLASKSIKRRSSWADETEAINYLKSKRLFAQWDDEMMDLYVRYGMAAGKNGGLELSCQPRREAALFMGGNQYDPWPLLEKITCPVLVIEGETSENRIFIDLKKIASLIPSGTYYEMKQAGHLIPMEQPDETARIMIDFFK